MSIKFKVADVDYREDGEMKNVGAVLAEPGMAALEERMDAAENDVGKLKEDIVLHERRIEALENRPSGEGTVKTVNGNSPDANGNVEVTTEVDPSQVESSVERYLETHPVQPYDDSEIRKEIDGKADAIYVEGEYGYFHNDTSEVIVKGNEFSAETVKLINSEHFEVKQENFRTITAVGVRFEPNGSALHVNGSATGSATYAWLMTDTTAAVIPDYLKGKTIKFRMVSDKAVQLNSTGSTPRIDIYLDGSRKAQMDVRLNQTGRIDCETTVDIPATAQKIHFIWVYVNIGLVMEDVDIRFLMYDLASAFVDTGETVTDRLTAVVPDGWECVDTLIHESAAFEKVDTKKYVDEHIPDIPEPNWGYLKPEDFGAKGDGTGDDSKAINDCLAAANSKNLPVRAFGKYRTESPISIIQGGLDIAINVINYVGNDAAVIVGYSRNHIFINRIDARSGDDTVGLRLATIVSGSPCAANSIEINQIYAKGACIEKRAVENIQTSYNRVTCKYLSGKCAFHMVSGQGENEFYGGGAMVYSSTYAIIIEAASGDDRFYGFSIESSCRAGILCAGNSNKFHDIRTQECMDQHRNEQTDETGIILKLVGTAASNVFDFSVDYKAVDTSEVTPYSDSLPSSYIRVHGKNAVGKMARYCNSLEYTNSGTIPGRISDLSRHDLAMNIVYGKKMVTYIGDSIYCEDVSGNYFAGAANMYPNAFNITSDCRIDLEESYSYYGINRVYVHQNGGKATIYNHAGTLIFDGADKPDGTYELNCTYDRAVWLKAHPYATANESWGKQNVYTGDNDIWVVH